MLVKELAKTLGRYGIRVNALVPGAIAAGGFVADPSLAKTHSARPARAGGGSRTDGAGGAVEQGVGLCHGGGDRGRRRAVADELVRAAGVGGFVDQLGRPLRASALKKGLYWKQERREGYRPIWPAPPSRQGPADRRRRISTQCVQ